MKRTDNNTEIHKKTLITAKARMSLSLAHYYKMNSYLRVIRDHNGNNRSISTTTTTINTQ